MRTFEYVSLFSSDLLLVSNCAWSTCEKESVSSFAQTGREKPRKLALERERSEHFKTLSKEKEEVLSKSLAPLFFEEKSVRVTRREDVSRSTERSAWVRD